MKSVRRPAFMPSERAGSSVGLVSAPGMSRLLSPSLVVVCCVISGLRGITVEAAPPTAEMPTRHEDLSFYHDAGGIERPIATVADWQVRRGEILAGMQEAMGPLPDAASFPPLALEVIEESAADGYVRRKIEYATDRPESRVRAWLLLPRGESQRTRAAALCLHQTTNPGKDQPVGLSDRPTLHFAVELTKRGYVTLSPDYPSFGEYPYDFDADDHPSGSMKAICDNRRAIDVLAGLPEVDASRIACIGHSLGGHNGLFTAVFDQRLKAVVTCCGFTAFHRYMGGDLKGWSGPRYMPRIATLYATSPNLMPFDFHEVLAAIAPRGVYVVAPVADDNMDVQGVREVISAVAPVFERYGVRDRLQVEYPECGHDFPDSSREAAYRFLDRVLASPTP